MDVLSQSTYLWVGFVGVMVVGALLWLLTKQVLSTWRSMETGLKENLADVKRMVEFNTNTLRAELFESLKQVRETAKSVDGAAITMTSKVHEVSEGVCDAMQVARERTQVVAKKVSHAMKVCKYTLTAGAMAAVLIPIMREVYGVFRETRQNVVTLEGAVRKHSKMFRQIKSPAFLMLVAFGAYKHADLFKYVKDFGNWSSVVSSLANIADDWGEFLPRRKKVKRLLEQEPDEQPEKEGALKEGLNAVDKTMILAIDRLCDSSGLLEEIIRAQYATASLNPKAEPQAMFLRTECCEHKKLAQYNHCTYAGQYDKNTQEWTTCDCECLGCVTMWSVWKKEAKTWPEPLRWLRPFWGHVTWNDGREPCPCDQCDESRACYFTNCANDHKHGESSPGAINAKWFETWVNREPIRGFQNVSIWSDTHKQYLRKIADYNAQPLPKSDEPEPTHSTNAVPVPPIVGDTPMWRRALQSVKDHRTKVAIACATTVLVTTGLKYLWDRHRAKQEEIMESLEEKLMIPGETSFLSVIDLGVIREEVKPIGVRAWVQKHTGEKCDLEVPDDVLDDTVVEGRGVKHRYRSKVGKTGRDLSHMTEEERETQKQGRDYGRWDDGDVVIPLELRETNFTYYDQAALMGLLKSGHKVHIKAVGHKIPLATVESIDQYIKFIAATPMTKGAPRRYFAFATDEEWAEKRVSEADKKQVSWADIGASYDEQEFDRKEFEYKVNRATANMEMDRQQRRSKLPLAQQEPHGSTNLNTMQEEYRFMEAYRESHPNATPSEVLAAAMDVAQRMEKQKKVAKEGPVERGIVNIEAQLGKFIDAQKEKNLATDEKFVTIQSQIQKAMDRIEKICAEHAAKGGAATQRLLAAAAREGAVVAKPPEQKCRYDKVAANGQPACFGFTNGKCVFPHPRLDKLLSDKGEKQSTPKSVAREGPYGVPMHVDQQKLMKHVVTIYASLNDEGRDKHPVGTGVISGKKLVMARHSFEEYDKAGEAETVVVYADLPTGESVRFSLNDTLPLIPVDQKSPKKEEKDVSDLIYWRVEGNGWELLRSHCSSLEPGDAITLMQKIWWLSNGKEIIPNIQTGKIAEVDNERYWYEDTSTDHGSCISPVFFGSKLVGFHSFSKSSERRNGCIRMTSSIAAAINSPNISGAKSSSTSRL